MATLRPRRVEQFCKSGLKPRSHFAFGDLVHQPRAQFELMNVQSALSGLGAFSANLSSLSVIAHSVRFGSVALGRNVVEEKGNQCEDEKSKLHFWIFSGDF